ncbi:hypothetical protein BJ741DRAFT_217016 [Chytriomyces cf. hyalinus JEL632]|nr:hypothetical protein BJ741DRAFT_217016 [Chytriomyces cf. hyalinus JEL632]
MMPALPCIPTFHSAPVTSSRSQACQNPSSFAAKRPSVCLTDDSNSSDNDSTSSSTYIFKHHNNVPKQSQSATSSQHQNAFLASMSPPKPGVCHFCKSCKTGQWRRGPGGMRTLCNACGINWCRKVRAYARVNGVSVGEAEATVGSDGAWFRRVVA